MLQFDLNPYEKTFSNSIVKFQTATKEQYVAVSKGSLIIEPINGWAISNGKALFRSYAYIEEMNLSRPSKLRKIWYQLPPKNNLEKALYISFPWNNYFHFYNDFIGQVIMGLEHGLNSEIPIVVQKSISDFPVFEYFLKNSNLLRGRQIYFLEPGKLIRVSKCYFVKPVPNRYSTFEKIILSLPPIKIEGKPKKIFLKRSKTTIRTIFNLAEVEDFFTKLGFELVDPSELDLDGQRKAFSNFSHLVSIHGAGLTNIIYNQSKQRKLFEMFSENRIPPHYFWMAKQFGYDYYPFIGSQSDSNQNFSIDLQKLEYQLKSSDFLK